VVKITGVKRGLIKACLAATRIAAKRAKDRQEGHQIEKLGNRRKKQVQVR